MTRASAATAVALVAAVLVLAVPGTAHADPAGPTDYRTEIVEVTPDPGTIEVSIAGGDSFVVVDVEPGTEVIVIGNGGEHYLRVDPDGTVWENQRSPDTYANAERFGIDQLPPEADATAAPEWRRVGSGGAWAWHDHRAHRMEPFPPLNVDRGGQVLDAVVPLIVNGTEVDVRVASTWMPPPSPWPAAAGVAIGLALMGALRRVPAIALAIVAAPALVVGVVQFRSLPAPTDPRWLWWLMPLIALGAATTAVVLDRRATRPTRTNPPGGPDPLLPDLRVLGATALAAVQLLVWGLERRHGLTRAILPTDAPFWADRLVSGAALAAGIVATLLVTAAVVRLLVPGSTPARSPG